MRMLRISRQLDLMAFMLSPPRGLTTSRSSGVGRVLRTFALLVVLSCLTRVCYHRLVAPPLSADAPSTFRILLWRYRTSRARPSSLTGDNRAFTPLVPLLVTQPLANTSRSCASLSGSDLSAHQAPPSQPRGDLTPFAMSIDCVPAMRDFPDPSYPNGPGDEPAALSAPQERGSARAAACRAELRNALQLFAAEARRREAEAECQAEAALPARPHGEVARDAHSLGRLAHSRNTADSTNGTTPGPTTAAAAAAAAAPVAAPADSAALLCSAAWRRAAMARAAASSFVAKMLRRNQTSLARIEARVHAVCRGVHETESRLSGQCSDQGNPGGEGGTAAVAAEEAGGEARGEAGTGARAGEAGGEGAAAKCGWWPEVCWPVPHMPFSDVTAARGRRFLVFAYSHEQLSNTRSHLVEAARFAQATNRTLVLPKGSRSRLSVGGALPLCDYFDLARIATHWISPELFLLLARAALTAPFAAAAARGASPSVAFVHVQTHRMWHLPFTQRCLVDILSELMVYGMGHAPSRRNTLDVIMPADSSAILRKLNKWRHTDVLVWVKTTFERMGFQPPTDSISFQMLPYSQEWHAMAQRAMARLPPRYIAVHYRSEFIAFHLAHKLVRKGFKVEAGVLEELMTGCMEAARDLINGMKRRHNISAVFIAADVPFDDKAGSLVRSDSWKETTWRFQGQERVLAAPQEKLRWLREQVAGTVMVDELMPAINHYDPGIVAILDKLLCAHAHVFLAGSITCGGGRGFEEDINIHRHHFNRTPPHRWVSETDKRLFHLNSSSAGAG